MNKTELIGEIALRAGITRKQAESIFNETTAIIAEKLETGEKVQISGFGTFLVKERAARCGRNPATGGTVPIEPTHVAVFKPGQELKEKVAKQEK